MLITEKKQIIITKHPFWDTLDTNWYSLMLKVDSADTTLLISVTVPLMNNYRIRSIMDYNDLIMLFTGVAWQACHKFRGIFILDINHSNIVTIFRMASHSGTSIPEVQIDLQSGRMSCILPKGTLE